MNIMLACDRRILKCIRFLERWPAAVTEIVRELGSASCGVERASILIAALAGAKRGDARAALRTLADCPALPKPHRYLARRAVGFRRIPAACPTRS